MSFGATTRALPTLVRTGVMQAVAYRAELFVWILTTSMPFVMLALFAAVAREKPLAGFGAEDFAAYFLATFIVRQFTGCWTSWEINEEVRTGTLGMRLLKPISPIVCYAVENLAAMPIRLFIAVPVVVATLLAIGTDRLPGDAVGWLMFLASWVGAWLVTFFVHVAIGTLSLWLEQSMKLMDVWFAGYMVLSGYLVPVALFPAGLRGVVDWLPWHAQIGLPVEMLLGAHPRGEALRLLAIQWGWVAVAVVAARVVWRRGIHRFSAYGG